MQNLEIAIFTNIRGDKNYSLVIGYSQHGTDCAELLSEAFGSDAHARICWVTPVAHDHVGHGTRIYPYTGQAIPWQTPEIKELLAAGPAAIEQRRAELYRKFYGASRGA